MREVLIEKGLPGRGVDFGGLGDDAVQIEEDSVVLGLGNLKRGRGGHATAPSSSDWTRTILLFPSGKMNKVKNVF
jgi:hypothetical protein